MLACRGGHLDTAKLLIGKGADINKTKDVRLDMHS